MKKMMIVIAICMTGMIVKADPGVDEKIMNSFAKNFGDAKEVSWSTSSDMTEVRFVRNKITARITYNKQGEIVRSMRYYGEESLPLLVYNSLKKKYKDEAIKGVVEICSAEGTSYYVTMEGAKHWINVMADSYGDTRVVNKFRKA